MQDSTITASQWLECASIAGCDRVIFEALCLVESRQNAFLPTGFPSCLYEPHVIWRDATKAERKILEPMGLAYPRQGEKPYGTYLEQQTKFYTCARLTRFDLAILGTSFGLLQILGENWKACAFSSPHAFFQAMIKDAYSQIHAGAILMRSWGMGEMLSKHDYVEIAEKWNGPGNVSIYSEKLEKAVAVVGTKMQPVIQKSRKSSDLVSMPSQAPQENLFWRVINWIMRKITGS